MSALYENIWHIASMFALVFCSAFFSGSETAFSNLTPRQIKNLRKSTHRLDKLTAELLRKPQSLLSCLLFGNMAVNVLFFALASILTIKINHSFGHIPATVSAAVCLLILVLFGEMLPKSISYANSKWISRTVTGPCCVLKKIMTPAMFLINFLIVEPCMRLLLGPVKAPHPITPGELKLLIETSTQQGFITTDENQLLGEIIEFGWLKVRHVMRPRVDMIACDISQNTEKAGRTMIKNNLTKLVVYQNNIDNLTGIVHLRDILLEPDLNLSQLVKKVSFVPEQKTVESLLDFFRKTQTDTTVVVDEYGGIAGSVSLTDILAELIGPIEINSKIPLVEQIGPMKYRLAGNLAIHDWAEAFGIETAAERFSTIAGFTTALLGKVPCQGNVAHFKNLKFTVEKVKKHRIESIILSIVSVEDNSE